MERIVNLHIEKLPEGFYLATSDEVQGLIAQGRTIQETIEIAQDVAKRLIEAQETRHLEHRLPQAAESFDYDDRECLMGRLAGFRYREIVKRLKQLGFEFDRQAAGSHEIWFNPETRRYTTIPNHPGDMPEGTLRAILKQAGVEQDRFVGK